MDRQGKPKKPVPPFDKVAQKSLAQAQGKKTQTHKVCIQIDKLSSRLLLERLPRPNLRHTLKLEMMLHLLPLPKPTSRLSKEKRIRVRL